MSEYRNPYEKRCARDLGPAYEYEAIRLPYVIEHQYVRDFIDRANKRIVKAKGRFPASDRKKMLAVKASRVDHRTVVHEPRRGDQQGVEDDQ
jgi:hypothetical protein